MDARTHRLVLLLAALLVTTGCDDDPPADADDDDTTEEPGPSCEDGYILDPDLPDEFLEEYPDGCVPAACGVGLWGNLEVEGDTIYVDASADEGGDGSGDAPFTSIQDGLDAAGDSGLMVVVAAGTNVENLVLTEDHDGVHLAGRCQELVVMDASEGEEDESGIRADGFMGDEEWWVSGITVTGAPYSGIWLDVGRLSIAESLLVSNQRYGAFAWDNSSELTLSNVAVLDTTPMADGTKGMGINIQKGASLVADGCLIEGNTNVGIFAMSEGTTVHLSNVKVQETQPLADGTLGLGIGVQEGASLLADGCLVEKNTQIGIFASDEGTTVHLSNVEIRETRLKADGTGGEGIVAQEGAFLQAEDCLVKGNAEVGIYLLSEGTMAILSNVEVRDTQPIVDGTYGRGINLRDGASLQAEDCTVEGNADVGIIAASGSVVHLANVEVRDTQPLADGTYGRGIEVNGGASLQAADSLVEGNSEIGILVADEGTVHLRDVEVRDTHRLADMTVAIGLACQGGGLLTASDVVVSQTEGPGLFASTEGTLSCTGCDLSYNTFAGALVWGGGILDLSDTTISDTAPDANEGGGVGIYVSDRYDPSTLFVENSIIKDQPYAAIWLEGDGSYTIRNSTLVAGYGEVIEHFDGTTTTLHGDGVVATNGVEGLWLENNVIQDSIRAGVLLDGSSAYLSGNTYTNNATDLVWQDCEGVSEVTGLAEVPDYDDRCSTSTLPIAPLEFNLILEEAEVAE